LEIASPWFATMGDAAAWFRWRRSIRFEGRPAEKSEVEIIAPPVPSGLPPARVTGRRDGSVKDASFHGGAQRISV
jgi:hypothetical protein